MSCKAKKGSNFAILAKSIIHCQSWKQKLPVFSQSRHFLESFTGIANFQATRASVSWCNSSRLGPGSAQERRARAHGKWAQKQLFGKSQVWLGRSSLLPAPYNPQGCHCPKSIYQMKRSTHVPTTSLRSWVTPSSCTLIPSSFKPSHGFWLFSAHGISQHSRWSPSHQRGWLIHSHAQKSMIRLSLAH